MTEIKDFSKARKQLRFKIDDDVFEAVPTVPAEVMIEFAEGFTSMDPTKISPKESVAALRKVVEFVLHPDSLVRFKERMSSALDPIDMGQLDEIVQWLFEEYGMRPTQESSSSLSGDSAPVPGTFSTANTQGVASISAASPLISS